MASIVFFRAVNVGGHQTFLPTALAKQLVDFGVVNIGAAGTFVVRNNVNEAKLRAAILRHLPFEPELMICPASEVRSLAKTEAFRNAPTGNDIHQFVSVLKESPSAQTRFPRLPICQPAGEQWEVIIVALLGRFVLSVRRRGRTYSNAVVEKHFNAPATTRGWSTIVRIGQILDGQTDTEADRGGEW